MIRGAFVFAAGLGLGYVKGIQENVAVLDKLESIGVRFSAWADEASKKAKEETRFCSYCGAEKQENGTKTHAFDCPHKPTVADAEAEAAEEIDELKGADEPEPDEEPQGETPS